MALPSVYTYVYGQLEQFLSKIRDGQAPDKFSQQHLKDIGFSSTNHRAFIPLLKAIGFLSTDGSPTQLYHEYRDHSKSRKVLGDALRNNYSDLFLIKANPTEKDKDLIVGKFKSFHNTTDRNAELMARTFFSLLALADISHNVTVVPQPSTEPDTHKNVAVNTNYIPEPHAPQPHLPGLHYNIQIHLPATKDIEVYNSIFKSLKEHLIA
jgi:hypothetical protein